MIKVSFRWFINEFKSSLKWWKVPLFIIITATLVIYNSGAVSNQFISIYWGIYLTAIVSVVVLPKFKKIDFLLPQDANSRLTYIITSSAVVLFFMIVWHFGINLINVAFGKYDIGEAFMRLLCRDILLLTIITTSTAAERYSPVIELTEEGRPVKKIKSRKEKRRTLYLIILMSYPTLHVAIFVNVLQGLWYGVSTMLAYPCTLAATYIILSGMSKSNFSYETIRKPVKII